MKPARQAKISRRNRRASTLILSLMSVLIFSTLAISMMTLSSTNLQLASNHHNVSTALATAQSGQEVIRYWLSRVLFSSSTPQANYLRGVIGERKSDLNANSGIIVADGDVINRAHQVVNSQAARKNINEEITSEQETDHGKKTK